MPGVGTPPRVASEHERVPLGGRLQPGSRQGAPAGGPDRRRDAQAGVARRAGQLARGGGRPRGPTTQGHQGAGSARWVARGAVIDSIVRSDLGPFFAILFIASSVYAATQVRRRDLLAAVIVPPLVFLTILGVHELVSPTGRSRALIDLVGDLVSTLALNAPTLWIGTGAAAVIVFVRHRRRR